MSGNFAGLFNMLCPDPRCANLNQKLLSRSSKWAKNFIGSLGSKLFKAGII